MLIRPGTAADLPQVHALVGELAAYEQASAEFVATLADYERDFAAEVFQVIIAETADGTVAGMILYFLTYSTWKGRMLWMEDFVVQTDYRRNGIGQLLFDAYLERAREMNCRLVKWQVLDWNEPAVSFYEKNGATIEQQWWNGKLFLK